MDLSDWRYYVWVVISFAITGLLLFFSIWKKWKFKTATFVMAGVCVFSELEKILTHTGRGDSLTTWYIRPKSLPFHICSIIIFIIFYFVFAKDKKKIEFWKSFIVPIGVFGGFLSIIMATSGIKFWDPDPFYAFDAYQSFIYHSILLWYSLYLMITKQVKLNTKVFGINCLSIFALCIIMIWVNSIISHDGLESTNFFFVMAPPAKGLPFLTDKYGWHVYFIHYVFGLMLLEFLVHLKYIIDDIKALKAKKNGEVTTEEVTEVSAE